MFTVSRFKPEDFDHLRERAESDGAAWKNLTLKLWDEGRGGLGYTARYGGEIALIGFILRDPVEPYVGHCPVYTSDAVKKCGREVTEATRGAMEEGFEKLNLTTLLGSVRDGFDAGHEWCKRLGFEPVGKYEIEGEPVTIYIKFRED